MIDAPVELVARLGGDPHGVPLSRPTFQSQDQVIALADLAGLTKLFASEIAIVLMHKLGETLVDEVLGRLTQKVQQAL